MEQILEAFLIEAKKVVETIDEDTVCPRKYVYKYNKTQKEIAGGKAWVMFFLDQLKEKWNKS